LEVLIAEGLDLCRGRRVGVLCHPPSVTSQLVHIIDQLILAGITPRRLFGPEHGVRGEAQDMVGVQDACDARTGIPVTSLYGQSFASLAPSQEALSDIDVLLVDLQDVGSRYYTYIWTMVLCLEAAGRAGVQVVVLDRPNPLGGLAIEGGEVAAGMESFVGLGSIPVRHGMTIGEIARLLCAGLPWGGPRFKKGIACDLEVIRMQGWKRCDTFDATGLPWVPLSPNMPTLDTAFVYPGACLIEGTNASEGRGTTRPFEWVGAPFIDGEALAGMLGGHDLPGVRYRPMTFRPSFHKFAGQMCGGVQLHVVDRQTFLPYRTGVALLRALWAVGGERFQWRRETYEFVVDRPALDLLTGGEAIRLGIERGEPLEALFATWLPAERAFAERRRPALLY
jgi:uncharacterized protein YbbC (DUF1343 family)